MKSWVFCWVFLVSTAQTATIAVADDQSAVSPLLGKWTWTRKENNCTEVYDFSADGSLHVVSGEEKTDNIFEVSSEPDQAGFYHLTITTLRDYRGRDCGDSDADHTGQTIDAYVLFDPAKNAYINCRFPNLSACFGPLNRAH